MPTIVWRKFIAVAIFVVAAMMGPRTTSAQFVSERFGNNPSSVRWNKVDTPHFRIVFPERQDSVARDLAIEAEQTYEEYKTRIGQAPDRRIVIYYNDEDEIVSDQRALNTDSDYSIWKGDPFFPRVLPGESTRTDRLRAEIAYAFQQYVGRFPISYYVLLISNPTKSPWSEGFVSWLAEPTTKPIDILAMRRLWLSRSQNNEIAYPLRNTADLFIARSQMNFFTHYSPGDSLSSIYTRTKNLFGLASYFDFNDAFEAAADVPYDTFQQQWSTYSQRIYAKDRATFESDDQPPMQPLFSIPNVLLYQGIALHQRKKRAAVLHTLQSGSIAQRLTYVRGDGSGKWLPVGNADKGYFDTQMEWSPSGDTLFYAKRNYDSAIGSYFFRLYQWNVSSAKSTLIRNIKYGRFPTIGSEGTMLYYAQTNAYPATIWRMNLQTGQQEVLYTFEESVNITHVDAHPTEPTLLISYQQEGRQHHLSLLNVASGRLNELNIVSSIPMNAEWSARGNRLFYNKPSKLVVNVYQAEIEGRTLQNTGPITDEFYGTEMWEVTPDSAGRSHVVGHRLGSSFDDALVTLEADQFDTPRAPTNASLADIYPDLDSQRKPALPQREYQPQDISIEGYNSFLNMQWQSPFFVPYYITASDFGVGGAINIAEPMRRHAFDIYGIFSAADPLNKSFFFSEYETNIFKPRIELNYNRSTATSDLYGSTRQEESSDVIALTALWRLNGLSRNFSDWYVGLTARHMGINYLLPEEQRSRNPDILYQNTENRQTDLKATLSWRNLEPSHHTLIHPLQGHGARVSVTGSHKAIYSDVTFARISVDAYTILPAMGEHRIYLYGNAAADTGDPIGRDYLALSGSANFRIPGPDFTGSVNPNQRRYVRGYDTSVLGKRYLFGSAEYRIPFGFDTNEKLLGFIPPARSSLTFFADGGVMGEARISENQLSTKYRLGIGAEIKRVFSISDSYKITYELGIAQGLSKGVGFNPYFNIKSAIPF